MLHVKPLYLCSFTSSCMFRMIGREIQCFLNKMETTVHLSSPLPFIWLIYKTRLTYNSTYIRSTKESLTFEYLDPPSKGGGGDSVPKNDLTNFLATPDHFHSRVPQLTCIWMSLPGASELGNLTTFPKGWGQGAKKVIWLILLQFQTIFWRLFFVEFFGGNNFSWHRPPLFCMMTGVTGVTELTRATRVKGASKEGEGGQEEEEEEGKG